MNKIESKVVVITGAARGIGLALVEKYLANGWSVAMLDIAAQTLHEAHRALDNEAATLAIETDVSKPEMVKDAVNQIVQKFGRIDALVNNAGVADFGPILDTSLTSWSRILEVNLTGPFICVQACAPVMLQTGGGSIVNITSISGVRASTLRVAYGTSKAGLMHLTRQQAAELGNVGIRVNAVSPGPVETEMAQKVHSAAIRADYRDAIPLGRYGSVAEIAEAVFFLTSDNASYINGQILAADGGFQATGIGLAALREQ